MIENLSSSYYFPFFVICIITAGFIIANLIDWERKRRPRSASSLLILLLWAMFVYPFATELINTTVSAPKIQHMQPPDKWYRN